MEGLYNHVVYRKARTKKGLFSRRGQFLWRISRPYFLCLFPRRKNCDADVYRGFIVAKFLLDNDNNDRGGGKDELWNYLWARSEGFEYFRLQNKFSENSEFSAKKLWLNFLVSLSKIDRSNFRPKNYLSDFSSLMKMQNSNSKIQKSKFYELLKNV